MDDTEVPEVPVESAESAATAGVATSADGAVSPADAATPARSASADDADGSAVDESGRGRVGRVFRFVVNQLGHYSFTGLVLSTVFLWLSATPSLLPRGPLFQGVVTGACAALGYCIGAFASWLGRFMLSRERAWPVPGRRWRMGLVVIWLAGWVGMLYWFVRWQNQVRDLMGVEHLRFTAGPTIIAVAMLTFAILMVLGRSWAGLIRWLVRLLDRIAPPRVSAVVGAGAVVMATIFLVNGVIGSWAMNTLNSTFKNANNETKADTSAPTTALRSGGPGSLVSWDSLGREGREIIGTGPTIADLNAFNDTDAGGTDTDGGHRPALEPIRVYAGVDSDPDIRDRADLVAAELERTGGLDRAVIAIGSTTGSGWLNKATIDSLEYMYNGDTAIASMQYSYLPSWLSFLVDQENARRAGKALFESIDEKVRAMPEADRPRLVVFGESLGSFGGESAFGTIPDIAARTDGALFSGPTFSNTLWVDTTRDRDEGSPAWLPIYDGGAQVRFISKPEDLGRPDAPWTGTRVVYLQHASDPISYWDPDMLLNEPEWMSEPKGDDVLDSVTWIPFISFLQLSADFAVATKVPDGHGHDYLSAIPYAWVAILQPPGWDDADVERLLPLLHRD